jgi:hypothetical protein
MIAVSDNWKSVHKGQLLPLSEIEIEYNVTEPGVQADANSTATPEETFSSAENVAKELLVDEPKYALLERNLWLLDGSYIPLPDVVPEASGFVSSNLSDADGTFTSIPTITLTFGEIHHGVVPGLTMTWSRAYEEWAEVFRVTVYNGSNVVTRFEVSDNREVIARAWYPISGYNKIVIEILKWCLPYRRARLSECLIGIKQVYTKNDLMGYEHEQSVDLLSAELPKNAIVFKLDNSTNKWNPDNPSGAEQYLIEKQTLKVKYGFRINGVVEWIKAGTFYMSEWNTPSNGMEASFTARDILEFCSEVYTGPRSGTLLSVAKAALAQSDIESNTYVLDEAALGAVNTDFTEDTSEYTCAEVLQMCANAGCCCLWQCRDGFLHMEPAGVDLTDYVIGQIEGAVNNSYSHPEFDLTKALKAVDVNQGMGIATNAQTGNVQTVDNPLIVSSSAANAVAEWCRKCLKNRKIVSGEYRADPRLDALDTVTVVSKYGSNPVQITNVKYTYNGAFRGTYTGRVME